MIAKWLFVSAYLRVFPLRVKSQDLYHSLDMFPASLHFNWKSRPKYFHTPGVERGRRSLLDSDDC